MSDIVIAVAAIPTGAFHAKFHKPRCASYKCAQRFRLCAALSMSPVILVSVWLNGIGYFFEYATQWATMMTIVYFVLIMISASKDRSLDAYSDQLNAIDDDMSANTLNHHSKSNRI